MTTVPESRFLVGCLTISSLLWIKYGGFLLLTPQQPGFGLMRPLSFSCGTLGARLSILNKKQKIKLVKKFQLTVSYMAEKIN